MRHVLSVLRSVLRSALRSALLVGTISACSSTTETTASASSSAATSASPLKAVRLTPASASAAPSSAGPPPSATLPKRKRPTGWKDEWKPAPDEGDTVFEFASIVAPERKDIPDPKTCPIDGPFWSGAVSFWGSPCSDASIAGCAEISERLYESGHWECAKAYHGLVCQKDPKLTAPPPSGGDYPMAGYPQCPPEKDPRLPWRDKELEDPTKKACYLGHDASACMKLAAAETDPVKRQWLGQLAAAWE